MNSGNRLFKRTPATLSAEQRAEQRAQAIPENVALAQGLPMSGEAEAVMAALKKNQVLVVAGETGSGKTTQLPKICLQAGYGRAGLIACTQPRRLAAVSVAGRIAEELGTEPGQGVAWQVRFDERSSPVSYIKVMTDGILLAELQGDRELRKYEVIIIDEAHERSLNIDFLLGYLKRLLPKRPDLKLIITSATIDVRKIASHFDQAPVIQVSGRGHPIETRYAPLAEGKTKGQAKNKADDKTADKGDKGGKKDKEYEENNASNGEVPADELQLQGIADALRDIIRTSNKGDVLVFLSSEREIRETAVYLRKQRLRRPGRPSLKEPPGKLQILPLYARLRHSEQQKIFRPHDGRRVVLSTNVAETSLTVPGIHFVIDPGRARISRYGMQHKVQRLPIEPVSRASADQRRGRCGRVAPGVCIRLYSEDDYNSRPRYTDPEIQRTNLAAVILRMLALGLGDVDEFPFIDPPDSKSVNDGFRLLQELNAVDTQRQLTDSGKLMAKLPADPRFAAMLVNGARYGALREMLIIVSALASQDPREQDPESQRAARQSWDEFSDGRSDFLGFVRLWEHYEERRQRMDRGQLRKHCRRHYLNFARMQEWRELHTQLSLACQQAGLERKQQAADYQSVHQCIIASSLNQIARHGDGRSFIGSRNRRFHLFPSSVLYGKRPKWIVTGQLIETENTFATLAARIEPQWVEETAMHIVKRECTGPHWSMDRQSVMAYEKLSLYGIVLQERRLVAYGDLEPQAARDIFIRDALVRGAIDSKAKDFRAKFLKHNRAFLAELEEQERRMRRPELIVSERDIIAFYEKALPENIYSTASLESWLQEQDQSGNSEALHMSAEKLQSKDLSDEVKQAFPDKAAIRHNQLQIDYVFEPGAAEDGATLKVPRSVLGQLRQADVDWAVPGLLRERCIALLKGLPKALRKHYIPVSDFVDRILPRMHSKDGELLDALLVQARKEGGPRLSRADLGAVELPPHLRIKIAVLDEEGEELITGTDLRSLQARLGQTAAPTAAEGAQDYGHTLEAKGLTDWSMEELPHEVTVDGGGASVAPAAASGGGVRRQGGLVLVRYPALVDKGDSVDLQLHPERREAERLSRMGVLRLYMLRSGQQYAQIQRQFSNFAKQHAPLLLSLGFNRGLDFSNQALSLCYQEACAADGHVPRSKADFEACFAEGQEQVVTIANRLEVLLRRLVKAQHAMRQRLAAVPPGIAYLRDDVDRQLGLLFAPGFITSPGGVGRQRPLLPDNHLNWLQQYPRYIQAISLRLDKVPHVGPKDRPNTEALAQLWEKYNKFAEAASPEQTDSLVQLRWMLEEYRVSLFAQQLGTSVPVSEKRIAKLFQTSPA